MNLNKNYEQLSKNYLFSEISRRVSVYEKEHPDKKLIRMGIGDVTLPLCQACVDGMKAAADEMSKAETFHGYGPEQGYTFLREKIKKYYEKWGVTLDISEIFISDGAKSDLGNILDIFSTSNTVLVPDPVYPVYVDTNTMDGREIIYANANKDNDFLPLPEHLGTQSKLGMSAKRADIIYMCSPNNPTGATYTREQLKEWVDYALANNSIILFDAAYEAFIDDKNCPHSIFEIEGAKDCAIEFCSLSKTAGFTGTRCGYTIVPEQLCFDSEMSVNSMWLRRQSTKFNGVSYIVQKGAEAVFTPAGQQQVAKNIAYYRENAKTIMSALSRVGIKYYGGKNSPYIWLKCPQELTSWEFFDQLLEMGIVGTPGSGFGKNGECYFRLTAFSTHENTEAAMHLLEINKKN